MQFSETARAQPQISSNQRIHHTSPSQTVIKTQSMQGLMKKSLIEFSLFLLRATSDGKINNSHPISTSPSIDIPPLLMQPGIDEGYQQG